MHSLKKRTRSADRSTSNDRLETARPWWHRASLIVVAAIGGGCFGFFGAASLAGQWVHEDGLILIRGLSILGHAVFGMVTGALVGAVSAWWWSRRWRSPR